MVTVLRGATTIRRNNKLDMQESVEELFFKMKEKNNLLINEISCIIFACTKDLTCGNPATCLRMVEQDISKIPLLCLTHHHYKGALKKCIRIMLMTNQNLDNPKHVYLNNAKTLREDLKDD